MQYHSIESNRVAQNEIVLGKPLLAVPIHPLDEYKNVTFLTVFLSMVTNRDNICKINKGNNDKEQSMFHCMYL